MKKKILLLYISFLLALANAQSGSADDPLFQVYLARPVVSAACVNERLQKGLAEGLNTCVLTVLPPTGAVDAYQVEYEVTLSYWYTPGSEPYWQVVEGIEGPWRYVAPIQYGQRRVEVFRVLRPFREAAIPALQRWFDYNKAANYMDATAAAVYTGVPVSIQETSQSVLFIPLLNAQRQHARPGGTLQLTIRVRVCGAYHCTPSVPIRF